MSARPKNKLKLEKLPEIDALKKNAETFAETYKLYLDPTFREEESKKMRDEKKMIEGGRYDYLSVGPDDFPGEDYPSDPREMQRLMDENRRFNQPIATPEQEKAIQDHYKNNPTLNTEMTLDEKRNGSWIQTYSGIKFFPLDPREEDVNIEDIAHALAMQCRFTGHCKFHYSIAQHSVLVSYFCDEADRLYGLLHDLEEAYLCDLATPLKRSGRFEEYKKIGEHLRKIALRKFGLDEIEPAGVKRADLLMLGIEAQTLLAPIHPDWKFPINPPPIMIMPLSPEEAERIFLARFAELTTIKRVA